MNHPISSHPGPGIAARPPIDAWTCNRYERICIDEQYWHAITKGRRRVSSMEEMEERVLKLEI